MMRTMILLIVVMGSIATQTQAQELVLMRGDEIIQGSQIDEDSWSFRIQGEEYLLAKKSLIAELSKKIELLQADTTHLQKIIAAKDTLLKSFDTYEKSAEEHIQTQKELITTADSLYTGYKDLYHDLKRIVGLSTFSLTPGIGILNLTNDDWKLIGSLGIGYHDWLGQFQFGKDYKGIVVGFRWTLF
jgi:hypothetical protein